jgi:glycosyltransferase involved in cell wall biosynthesis
MEYAWHPLRTQIKNRFVARDVSRVLSITRTGAKCFGDFGRTDIVRDWPSFDPRGTERNLREELGLASDAFVILVPGGQSFGKGSRIAMQAWNHVTSTSAVLLLLGYEQNGFSGRGASCELACIRKDRRKTVHCLPRTIDMKSVMRQSGLIVSPFCVSHASKAILDAASLGIASITADGGEAREYVEDGRTGLIVPPGDPVALAAAIDRLAADRVASAAMGAAARAKVEREFNRDRSMRQIEDAYAG